MSVDVIINFFTTYGWQLGLLALSGIVVLGFLKKVGVFKKLKDDYKKYVYFGLSCLFSIVACTIYLLINGAFAWGSYAVLCLMVMVVTIVSYHIYEHIGLRWVWNKCLDLIGKLIKYVVQQIALNTLTTEGLKKKALKLGAKTLQELTCEAQRQEVIAQRTNVQL